MDVSNVGDWVLPAAGGVIVIGGAVVLITKGFKWVFSTIRKVNEFLEDWRGEDARPGHARRLGVPERLESIETRLVRVEGQVNKVKGQVESNGGSSLRDAVDRIERHTVTDQDK